MDYGLIGEKLGHSYSKIIHEKLEDYSYQLQPLSHKEFSDFMKKRDFKGINVTIPYKEDVIPYIDMLDENAKKIGAVNTIVHKNNKLYGYNTDYYGFLFTLEHEGIEIAGKKVVVLGTGGAAKSILVALSYLNAKEVITVKRTATNGAITYEECYNKHKDAQVIINTSPVGMYPDVEDCPIHLDVFNKLEAIVDIIYNPLKTKLLIQSEELGILSVNGLLMLVAQAVYATGYFLDKSIEKETILKVYYELKDQMEH